MKFWGKHCAVCNSPDNLQVHHRRYDHLGEERITDVILLCDECHRKFHGIRHGMEPIQVVLERYIERITHGRI
jgi:5-methylcytosine-specific restriction endonuclease McrA